MISVFINDIEINYDDKIALNKAFNEALDSGVLIIPNTEELAINRLDSVVIKENDKTINFFLVGTIVKEFETFEKPFKYKYTLELVSPTIQLQSIVLPNISATQPLSITGVAKRSIYYQIKRLVDVFAKDFTISEELQAATENIECPDLQWNRKTLFEILNDLLINVPAVVTVLENKVISLIRLDLIGEEINHNQIVNITQTDRLDEYCTEIEIQGENVVENESNAYTQLPLSARSQQYILTTDNAQIILDKPIYTLDKLEVYLGDIVVTFTSITGTNTSITIPSKKYDISKYVIEESVYNTKIPSNVGISPFKKIIKEDLTTISVFNEDALKYRRSFVSYQQGNNVIDNLTYKESNIVGWTINQYALQVAISLAVAEHVMTKLPNGAYNVIFDNADVNGTLRLDDVRDITFNVEYTTLGTIRFRTKKPNSENMNYKLLIDNQSNSYVSSKALWQVEKENIRRVGNRELKIHMITNSIADTPSYGAKFTANDGTYILTNSIVNVYQEKVIFEGYFTKDYIRKNLYTGLKSKARWTSIAKASEALARQDLIIINYELSTERKEISNLTYRLVKNLAETNYKDIKVLLGTLNGTTLINRALLNASYYSFGNNLLLSLSMKDNYSAGMKVDGIVSSQYVTKQVPYVDELGEFEKIKLDFVLDDRTLETTSAEEAQQLPKYEVSVYSPIEEYQFLVLKDNREIYGVDVQIEFNGKNGVIVYDEFIKQMPVLLGKKTNNMYFFALDKELTNDDINISTETKELIDFSADYITGTGIQQPTFNTTNIKCWGICTEEFNTIIACNSNAKTIYFNKGGNKLC